MKNTVSSKGLSCRVPVVTLGSIFRTLCYCFSRFHIGATQPSLKCLSCSIWMLLVPKLSSFVCRLLQSLRSRLALFLKCPVPFDGFAPLPQSLFVLTFTSFFSAVYYSLSISVNLPCLCLAVCSSFSGSLACFERLAFCSFVSQSYWRFRLVCSSFSHSPLFQTLSVLSRVLVLLLLCFSTCLNTLQFVCSPFSNYPFLSHALIFSVSQFITPFD